MNNKYTLRVPTEQYAFIELSMEGTSEEAYEAYNELLGLSRGGVGLPDKEWRELLDSYMEKKTCTAEDYYKCNTAQQLMIQELKKHFKRVDYKNNK